MRQRLSSPISGFSQFYRSRFPAALPVFDENIDPVAALACDDKTWSVNSL